MPFFLKIKDRLTLVKWLDVLKFLQKWCAYLPVILVPIAFSPISVDPFFIEKLVIILLFSSLSLFFFGLKLAIFRSNYKDGVEFKYSKSLKWSLIILIFVFFTQLFSINFNLSFWGVGTMLFLGIFIWTLAVHQVFDKSLLKACLVLGITLAAGLNILILISRFTGTGIWESVNSSSFSFTGDFFSLIFILFLGIALSLKNLLNDKYKYFYISSLFLNTVAFIIYSFFTDIYILSFVALGVLFIFYFLAHINAFKRKESDSNALNKLNYVLKIIVIVAAIIVGIFEIFLQKNFIPQVRTSLPLNYSWGTAVNAVTESPKNFVLGVGSNNYYYSFLHFKPQDVNTSSFWGTAYNVSPHGILELFINFGAFIFILLLIICIIALKDKNFIGIIKRNKYKSLSIVLGLLLLSFTPLIITVTWVIAVFLVVYGSNVNTYKISLIAERDKKHTYNLGRSLLLVKAFGIIIPIFVLIIYLYSASITTALGKEQINLQTVDKGVITFPYYSKIYTAAIDTGQKLTVSVDRQNLAPRIREYARLNSSLNSNDPASLQLYSNILTQYEPEYATYTIAFNNYQKLIDLAPLHIPYFLTLADVSLYFNNNDYAGSVLDHALTLNPNLDVTLIKRANVYYLQSKFTDARTMAQKAKAVTQDQSIKDAADSIISKAG